ncbi:hypothetical protein [Microbacterium sp. Leaf203]|uniref:hypothetical protein n=1 Tax=Microbacterium sp. Leaf203 TaxID=1735677 RepID=UPI0006F84306|nr:hypothetical protein [Microbacterium sp. Leaf203]KQM38411.1 hypothetical protein ASE56_14105 [Microbacterium sp. Leaf203]
MTVEAVRESTDAERDAGILSHLRDWWMTVARRDKYTLGHEEVDLLLRVADERDELRREMCADADSKYVIRACARCGHEPHGYLLPCNRQSCGCRDGRPKP